MISRVSLTDKNQAFKVDYNVLPWKFEAGTPNIVGGIGLMEAVKYLKRLGMDNVARHEGRLVEYTLKRLNGLDWVEYYGPNDPDIRGGLIAFNIKGLGAHETASLLDDYGIMVRSGHHCAQPLHEFIGVGTSARASFYIYNTEEEIDYFIECLGEIISILEG